MTGFYSREPFEQDKKTKMMFCRPCRPGNRPGLSREFLFGERVDNLQPGPGIVRNISRGNSQVVSARRRSDKAVWHGHKAPFLCELGLLPPPNSSNASVKIQNPAFHRRAQPIEPGLKGAFPGAWPEQP